MTDRDAKQIMLDGGLKLCRDAIREWLSNKYTPYPISESDEKMKRENVARWRDIESAIKNNGRRWLKLPDKREAK